MSEDPQKSDGAAEPSPAEPVSRSAQIKAQQEEADRRKAEKVLAEPIDPDGRVRCARCGRLVVEGEPDCARCGVAHGSPEAGRRIVPHGNWISELLLGLGYVPRGALTIMFRPRLWKTAVVPFLVNLVMVLLVGYFVYRLGLWLESGTHSETVEHWWWPLRWTVQFLAHVFEFLACLVVPLLTTWLLLAFPFSIVYSLIFMPFKESLSEATEQAVLGIDEDANLDVGFWKSMAVGAIDSLGLFLLQGLLMLLLLPLNVIPGLGLLLPPALIAGIDYSDLTLVRHGYRTWNKRRLWTAHFFRFTGYGLSFFFLLGIPILNAVVIPSAAAGAALLYLELDRK